MPGAPGRRGDAGFTLIELLVAMLLFAFFAAVMMSFYPAAALNGRLGENLSYATHLAGAQLEDIRAKTFAYVVPANYTGSQTFTQGGTTFTRTVAVTPCGSVSSPPCSSNANLTEVAVSVTWLEPSTGSSRTVTVTTLLQNYF